MSNQVVSMEVDQDEKCNFCDVVGIVEICNDRHDFDYKFAFEKPPIGETKSKGDKGDKKSKREKPFESEKNKFDFSAMKNIVVIIFRNFEFLFRPFDIQELKILKN